MQNSDMPADAAPPTNRLVAHAGDTLLISALARSWGVAAKCKSCGQETRRTPAELLKRFWRHLDMPLTTLFTRAVCANCGASDLSLYAYNAAATPLPSPTYMTHEKPDQIADMEELIRAYAREQQDAEPSPFPTSYAAAKAR